MYIPPIVNKYTYAGYERIEGGSEGRLYSTPSGNLPSVTTILSATSDDSGLQKWRAAIGEEKAKEITLEATTVGTFMHENLERRLVGDPDHKGGMPIRVLARNMADCIQSNAWPKINEVWGQEVPLYYEGLWAGTTDLVGMHDGIPSIMDYKNSRKPKTWEYIENYRLQLAAYALAHNQQHGKLEQFYKDHCSYALRENSHLTLAEIKTLVFDELKEDLTTSLKAGQIAKQNNTQQQTQINPQTAAKLKQAELQKNANNANFKVTVPGQTNGTSEVEPVVGVDVGPTTDQTLVVTKDTEKPNQLSVFGLGDVEPVQEAEYEENDSEDTMAPPDVTHTEQTGSPFTHENPGMGELSHAIGKIESDDYSLDGEESPEGNEGMNNADEVLSQIIDFCSRMRGR